MVSLARKTSSGIRQLSASLFLAEGKRVACVWVPRALNLACGPIYRLHGIAWLGANSVMKIDGLPVIDVDESEEITVAVRADDLLEGDTEEPKRHPIAIALRRQDDVDDARVTKNETLVRRGKKWFRYNAPGKRLFKRLQKTLTAN